MAELNDLINNHIPPWLKKFIKGAGRGINEFNMIKNGDRILLGVSGGKDSLSMAIALSLRKRWLPITYELSAIQIEWKELPLSTEERDSLFAFFSNLDIPFKIINAEMRPESFKGKFNCYLCSRNRKRILFTEAEKAGIDKIALGHHLDDLIETTLINLFFRGNFSTMMPVQSFFKGKLRIIRPLCRVKEQSITGLARKINLPVISTDCGKKESNIREQIKPIIKSLLRIDKHLHNHIFNAHYNIKENYLLSWLNQK